MKVQTGTRHRRLAARCFVLLAFAVLSRPCLKAQVSPTSSPLPQQADQSKQEPAATSAPQTSAASEQAEMSTRDSSIPLQSRVNLVPIRVVVRDAKGHTVGNLHKEDFRVFEDGKLQDISHFSVETPKSVSQTFVRSDSAAAGLDSEKPAPGFLPPSRFVGLLFDDVHTAWEDLLRVRQAATAFVDTAMQPTDRVALFTISGQSQMDFTGDREKLHSALVGLQVRPVTAGASKTQCPPIDYYQADLIVNKHDEVALSVAVADTVACAHATGQAALLLAESTALEVNEDGALETQSSFRRVEEVLRRISALPGQRTVVLLSPGFIYPDHQYELSQIIDRANRASITVNTLDARGLYTPDMGDISQPETASQAAEGPRFMLRQAAQSANSDVLMALADGTGGSAFRNNNDLSGGLRMIAGAPEVSYLVAFTPYNLKYNGKFHALKVTLATKAPGVTVQARRGFYAPKHEVSIQEAAKEEMEEALFSQDVQHGVPVELHTQYYKVDSSNAKVAVMTHVDIARLRFAKAEGRNQDNLVILAALFDQDGNMISGIEKTVEMHLRDVTMQRLSRTGVTVKTSFDVKPGDYVVRLVVRDANGAQLSAENGVVEIPY